MSECGGDNVTNAIFSVKLRVAMWVKLDKRNSIRIAYRSTRRAVDVSSMTRGVSGKLKTWSLKLEALDHRSPMAIVMGWTPSRHPPGGRWTCRALFLLPLLGRRRLSELSKLSNDRWVASSRSHRSAKCSLGWVSERCYGKRRFEAGW